MNARKWLMCWSGFAMVLGLFSGCRWHWPVTPSTAEALTPTPKLSATAAWIAIIPSPTPAPTLPVVVGLMLEQMQSEDCTLPCYLGITPGRTTVEEAMAMLEHLGGEYLGSHPEDTYTSYSYILSPVFTLDHRHSGYSNAYISIKMTSKDDVVQSIRVVAVLAILDKPFEPWLRWYSVRGVFQQMGQPDRIFFQSGESIAGVVMVYQERGATIGLASQSWKREDGICTGNMPIPLHVSIGLNDLDLANLIYNGRHSMNGLPVGQPVEKVLGISEAEFYQWVISDPSACFEASESNP